MGLGRKGFRGLGFKALRVWGFRGLRGLGFFRDLGFEASGVEGLESRALPSRVGCKVSRV